MARRAPCPRRWRAGAFVSATLEEARDAAQTDAVIDAAAALVEAAGSYTAALLALASDAALRGGADQASAIEACAEVVAGVEAPGVLS